VRLELLTSQTIQIDCFSPKLRPSICCPAPKALYPALCGECLQQLRCRQNTDVSLIGKDFALERPKLECLFLVDAFRLSNLRQDVFGVLNATPPPLWRRIKHLVAVEPSIGHLKNEHRLERNRLKGVAGDAVNAVLAAAAMNFQKLLRAAERKLLARIVTVLGRLLSLWTLAGQNINMQAA